MTPQAAFASFWATVAACRQDVVQLLATRYGWPRADCEDAVSLAAVRTVACLPVEDVQAYLYRVSQRILLHQMRDDGRHTKAHAVLDEALVCPSVNPARQVQAAHDLAYYLSVLSPNARDRLVLTHTHSVGECALVRGETLNTVKVSNWRARQMLTHHREAG